jgi:hypothetical protein
MDTSTWIGEEICQRPGSIIIQFPPGKAPEILVQAETEGGQHEIKTQARRIKQFLDRPTLMLRLARLVLPCAAAILTRMKFTPRRSLLLDRLIIWAGK